MQLRVVGARRNVRTLHSLWHATAAEAATAESAGGPFTGMR